MIDESEEEVFGVICPMFGSSKYISYAMVDGRTIRVSSRNRDRVVVNNSEIEEPKLFIDNVWPGSLVMSDYLCKHPELCVGKTVIELGAGTALPSMVAAKLGSKHVVITDYPDDSVIENIVDLTALNNVQENTTVIPHKWGDSVSNIWESITENTIALTTESTNSFQLILIAEPLWKDTYPLHNSLLHSISVLLSKSDGIALISFAHRPTEGHVAANDLEFFTLGREKYGLKHTYVGACNKYADAL